MKFFEFSFILLLNFWMFSTGLGQEPTILKKDRQDSATRELNELDKKMPAYRKLYSEGIISKKEMQAFKQKFEDLSQSQRENRTEAAQQNDIVDISYRSSRSNRSMSVKSKSGSRVVASVQRNKRSYSTKSVVYKSKGSMIEDQTLQGLKAYYYKAFQEELPISAMGQSATHDRFGWDHSGRVDVGLHPDSERGQEVMNYLREHNVAYIGFRASVPGCSTAPHIHIGLPSSRLR
jgi:hypothetical protein